MAACATTSNVTRAGAGADVDLVGRTRTQVGVATGRRLAALRPDLPFTLIDNTKACPELERPTAVIDAIRADI